MEFTRNKRLQAFDFATYGKVPPQDSKAEIEVLGALMVDKEAYDKIADILKPECFYTDVHQRVYKAIKILVSINKPVDLITVVNQLQKTEELELVGGPYFLSKLTDGVTSSVNIETHAKIIIEKFIQRELIRISGEIITQAYMDTTDAFALLDQTQQSFSDIDSHLSFGEMTGIDSVLVEAVNKIEDWRKNDSYVTGVPSGFPVMDKVTRGWQPDDFVIIAARPGVGKTAFALSIARNAAEHFKGTGETVAIWSLEMKPFMMVLRMLASESKILLQKILTGKLSDADMKELYDGAVKRLAALNIMFDKKTGLTIQKLKSKARRLKKKNKLGLIIIDYLQLMEGEGNGNRNRENDVSKISRELKNLNLELGVPIIALSQLSREVEKRASGIPILADLRESGSIEQDAETVIFLYSPTDAAKDADADLNERVYAKIAKQRNGALMTIDLNFKDEIQLFQDLENMSSQFPAGGWRPIRDDEKGYKASF